MLKETCNHKFEYHTDIKPNGLPATVICKKCKANISLSDSILIDQVRSYQLLTRISIGVAIVALAVSIVALFT